MGFLFVDTGGELLQLYEKMDEYFVETDTYKRGEEIFHKYGIVIWTGIPGCGKTTAALHLIKKQLNNTTTSWSLKKNTLLAGFVMFTN